MSPRRLHRLGFSAFAFNQLTNLAILAQPFTWNFRVIREWDLEDLTGFSAVADHHSRREVMIAIGLIRNGAHATATKNSICHVERAPFGRNTRPHIITP